MILSRSNRIRVAFRSLYADTNNAKGFLASFQAGNFLLGFTHEILIVITFYSPICLGLKTAKRHFGLQVKLPYTR